MKYEGEAEQAEREYKFRLTRSEVEFLSTVLGNMGCFDANKQMGELAYELYCLFSDVVPAYIESNTAYQLNLLYPAKDNA